MHWQRTCGAKGHKLVLASRHKQALDSVATQIPSITVATDVTKRDEVERLRDAAISEFGYVDVWINNAGRGIGRKVMDLSDEDLDEMISVNLKSVLYGMQAIVPHFQARGTGHLINTSSFLGRVPPCILYRSAYNAAKHAMNALTANLRMDLKQTHPSSIHVSLVMPGLVSTDFAKNALGGSPQVPTGAAGAAQTPEEVAQKIAELIVNPVAEIYTNPASYGIAQAYFKDVAAFEENMLRR